ncbi:MAG: ABC transporter ATP-binding protein [Candidatus Anstonellales archaeon]
MEVREKEIVSLIGANGAGKTTLLWTIIGLLRVTSGVIGFEGEQIQNLKPHEILRRGIVLCPSERHIFPKMTVFENLKLGAYLLNQPREISKSLERVFHFFPRLKERKNQLGGTLSGGEQQMLAMARAVMSNPKLLLLDEPSLGLAPIVIKELENLIQEINQDGTTIILVEQNARLALGISLRTYVLELGEIVLEGKSNEISDHERIKKAFLGEA